MKKPPIRKITKSLVGGIVAVAGLLTSPPVYSLTLQGLQLLQKFPRTSVLGGGLLAVLALLHDPRVIEALGKKRVTTTEDVVSLAPAESAPPKPD